MAEPAARYVQKYSSMLSKKVKDEFFVHEKDVILITQFKDKIENVYQIKISFEQKAEDGQWLILDGEPVDRRNAKNYITAMCNPVERKQVQFPSTSCTELTDPATLELIEKRTNAFIRPLEKIAQFEISGTELAITLAFSEIEELAGAALEGDESQFDDEAIVDADGVITISPNTRNGSTRLSSVLERALSANSDGVCSVEDYRHARPAVQRVLANCLQNDDDDIDDDQLFAEGPTTGTSKRSNLMVFYEGSAEERDAVSTVVDANEVTEVQPALTSPPGAFTDKMTGLAISSPPSTALLSKQQDYLRSFGVLVGFQEAEVDKAIKFVDEKTRPSDFLDMLNSLQQQDSDSGDDVVILETETIDLTNDEQASHTPNDSCDTSKSDTQMQGTEENYQSTLPDGYKDMLIRDFFAESENSSADELKRRNAERQKLLRQNFENQQSNQHRPQPKGTQPSSVVSKKQNAKGKTKQWKNKQRNAEKQSDRTDMHDKQFRLDSAKNNNNETSSHNDEETCVLRVWNNDQDQTGAGTSAQEPVQTTPKRKNSKGRNNQTQLSQPIWVGNGGNNQRQNSPNRSSQPVGQWPQPQGQKFNQPIGSPGKGHFRKPTQVVTPVNAANGRFDKMAPQRQCRNDQAELRYVVIDGSNVAMTHGNGKYFSCKGIKLCVDYFRQHGHDKITVFVPQWRQYRPSDDNPILDQDILRELKEEDILVFTPSRRIGRRLVVAYDDRFVLELAEAEDGVIVSNDQYRDLMTEKAGWRKLIEERLLMYSFAKDLFMPPNDPLGREGPCLADFLRVLKPHQFTPVNPRQWQAYDYHHEQQQHYKSQGQLQQIQGQFQHGQGQQGHSQVQQYQGQFQQGHGQFQHDQGHCKQGHGQYSKSANHGNNSENSQPVQKHGYSVKNKSNQGDETDCGDPYVADHVIGQWKNPQRWDKTDGGEPSVADHVIGQWKGPHQGYPHVKGKVQGHPRTIEETRNLLQELRRIFPESAQEKTVDSILTNHESERDLTKLTNYLMNVLF